MRGMGRVFRRGRVWWIAYCHEGREYRESSHTQNKSDATLLLRKRLAELGMGKETQPIQRIVYLGELLDMVEKDYMLHKRRSPANWTYLRRVRAEFAHLSVLQCTKARIAEYQQGMRNNGKTPEAINRECTVLRRAFTLGYEEGLVERQPIVRRLTETSVRQGFFEAEELAALLQYLPPEIGDVARFGYLTGWRKGEILGLEWANVDRRNRVIRLRPDQTKTDEQRVLAVEGELWGLMEKRWHARISSARLLPWVFHRHGKPISSRQAYWHWQRACKRATLQGKLFHDFRRTAARNMIRQGIPERVVMSITGHKTRLIFDRYNIVTEADQRQALRTVFGHISDKNDDHAVKSD